MGLAIGAVMFLAMWENKFQGVMAMVYTVSQRSNSTYRPQPWAA